MKVFWSWQADYEPNYCRRFIKTALEAAIDQTALTLDVEDALRPSIDHDTKGEPGFADISATILRKIAEAELFVADATPVATTTGGKLVPNPNVMIELGWAMRALGPDRIILLLNTSSGARIEDLPFDIRNRRVMTYQVNSQTDSSDRKKILNRLTAELRGAIATNYEIVQQKRADEAEIVRTPAGEDKSIWAGPKVLRVSTRFDRDVELKVADGPRVYFRASPSGWSSRPPRPTRFVGSDTLNFWPTAHRSPSGDSGVCELGYAWFWRDGDVDADGILATRLLNLYLEDSGEFWAIDGACFWASQKDGTKFYFPSAIHSLKNALQRTMTLFDALGATPARQFEVGISGAQNSQFQYGWRVAGRARKDSASLLRRSGKWDSVMIDGFLAEASDLLLDLYAIPALSEEEIRKAMQTGEW